MHLRTRWHCALGRESLSSLQLDFLSRQTRFGNRLPWIYWRCKSDKIDCSTPKVHCIHTISAERLQYSARSEFSFTIKIPMPCLQWFMLLASLFLPRCIADASPSASCECYTTSQGTYFSNHRFWDWRNLTTQANVFQAGSEPPNITINEDRQTVPDYYLNLPQFSNDWEVKTWRRNSSKDHPLTNSYVNSSVYLRQFA